MRHLINILFLCVAAFLSVCVLSNAIILGFPIMLFLWKSVPKVWSWWKEGLAISTATSLLFPRFHAKIVFRIGQILLAVSIPKSEQEEKWGDLYELFEYKRDIEKLSKLRLYTWYAKEYLAIVGGSIVDNLAKGFTYKEVDKGN